MSAQSQRPRPAAGSLGRLRRWLLAAGGALLLALAFAGYLSSSFIADLANRIALCM